MIMMMTYDTDDDGDDDIMMLTHLTPSTPSELWGQWSANAALCFINAKRIQTALGPV